MRTLNFSALTYSFILVMSFSCCVVVGQESKNDETGSLNEQTIYVPYEKLREVFERDGRGVFLPYDKFQQLWNEARQNQPKKLDLTAPLGALITGIESTATLGKEIVNVDATIKIELLREGWHRVPIRLSNAAIRSATIDDKVARVVSVKNGQYELLISHDGGEPKTIELNLSYAKALTKNGGQSTVAFQSPQAPVNRWTIRTGQKDIDVQIEPMIASSKIPDEKSDETKAGQGDEILAFVGAAPEVKIMWTPKAEGASGLSALVSADTQTRFQIDQGVARTSATISLDISRAEINTVSIDVPADQKVVSVFDRNVKKWEVEQGGDSQTIKIDLFEPTLGRQVLAVELEKFIDEIDDTTINMPQIRVDDVSRNSGVVLVNLSAGLRAETEKKTGLLQMDVAELPGNVKKQSWEFAYRYASLPFGLALNVKKIQPLVSVEQLVEVAIEPEKLNLEVSAIYDIQLAGLFQLDLDIPKEFEIREIRGISRKGLVNLPVEAFYRDPKNESRVLVTLGKKAIGKIGLQISLDRELQDVNLLSPTDVASKINFAIPKATIDRVEFSKGNVIVYSPESLQVNAAETKGLRNDSFKNALASHVPAMAVTGTRPVLAYSFSHTDASIELEAKRRRPQVTVEQVVVVSVQSGVVKYDTRLFYEVLYSGVKSLRLDVPTALVADLRNRSPNILKQVVDPQPENVPTGYTTWELTGDNEFFGKHQIRFTWEKKIADLPLGESADVAVDRLIPANVDRANGQIVLTKSETIDIRPKSDAGGLRPIDPQTDLAQGVSVENAAMAFEFVDDWSLNLTATRFELQELKRTSISRAVVRAVALRQNELSVQCLYQIRSVGQRISIQMPAGFDAATSFDDQPIRVNGRRVTPENGGKDLIYVPLTGLNSDELFLLEIRYTIPGDPSQIDLPLFVDEPAVQKVYLCVYLPFERALLHRSGDWTDVAVDEHTNSIAGLLSSSNQSSIASRIFQPRTEHVEQYLNWVQSGVDFDSSASQKFEVDGRPYVFSALRPNPAPAGSLHLRTINLTVLNVIVFGVIALLGLMLIRTRFTTQMTGALLVIASFVAVGVFFPLVAEHLFSETLLLTVGVVGLAWLTSNVIRWFGEIRNSRREQQILPERQAEFATAGAMPIPTNAPDAIESVASSDSPPDSGESEEGESQ
jgi:hypothetical protein